MPATALIFDLLASFFLLLVGAGCVSTFAYLSAVAARDAALSWKIEGIANRRRLDEAIAEQRVRLERERAAEAARLDAEVRRVLAERVA